MKIKRHLLKAAILLAISPLVYAFDSGSTGEDGAFNPTVSTVLDMPEDGIFNFTSVNIPDGVTVTFNKNTTNTPVVMLVSGDATIAGTLSVAGQPSADVGAAGDGALGDDGLPGIGGPGGFDGGRGGYAGDDHYGATGLGPGGGQNGWRAAYTPGGSGGSFGTKGANGTYHVSVSLAGPTYGSALLLPLIGGSGGGGGGGGTSLNGSGGGGGGGAILLAASGTVTVTGNITANGGRSGGIAGSNCGSYGGGGAGGGIRVVATTLAGNGTIQADGGASFRNSCGNYGYYVNWGGAGGAGRIRLEAETITRTAGTSPVASLELPGDLFVEGLPTLRIASVAGVDAPALPTGQADIVLPADTVNPVAVTFEATGIPVGNIVELTLTPAKGAITKAISDALEGSTGLSSASTSISLSDGASTLSASVTYTITLAMAESLQFLADGEEIASIKVQAEPGKPQRYFLITKSGREIPVESAHLASFG